MRIPISLKALREKYMEIGLNDPDVWDACGGIKEAEKILIEDFEQTLEVLSDVLVIENDKLCFTTNNIDWDGVEEYIGEYKKPEVEVCVTSFPDATLFPEVFCKALYDLLGYNDRPNGNYEELRADIYLSLRDIVKMADYLGIELGINSKDHPTVWSKVSEL